MSVQSAFPLCWPAGWKRSTFREHGQFDGTPDKVRRDLLQEIDRIALGKRAVTHTIRAFVVVSTDVPLRKDGEPHANFRPNDPGVAVYFKRNERPVCLACDKYDAVWKNMRAIAKTIEALRGIERWGSSQLLDRAFEGFTALPEKTGPSCWDVLGLDASSATETEVTAAYREKAKDAHPDQGGSSEAFNELTQAKDIALATLRSAA
ncbi:MAG TPA: J domain-containing protein [Chthoniobacterales bacterium]|jgi:hypothetical protein|nr:J domain-containing protein [Chthoniobacterales bacterium]